MSEFQRLCLLRCFRADRIYRAVMLYVSKQMGDFFVQPPIISIDGVFDQSTTTTPVVFILSPGADPAGDLTKLADRSGTITSTSTSTSMCLQVGSVGWNIASNFR